MTVNPNSPEIKRKLKGLSANHRPDIIQRVFEMKKKHLLDLLFKQNIFGETVGRSWSVEFQKRGLPHIHIIVIFKKRYGPQTVEDYD